MSMSFLFKILPILMISVFFVFTSCSEEKKNRDWIEDLETSQNNSQPTVSSSVPNIEGDWIQVKMEFSSPFNGDNVANVDFENQVVWSFSKDSLKLFEYPKYQWAHVPYHCKDNTVLFKQANDAPADVVHVFEQIGDTIKFTNTQGPITNYVYFVPFEEDENLALLKESKINWEVVLEEDWEFFNVRQLPGFDAISFDDFTPPSGFTKDALASPKFDIDGDVISYNAQGSDYDLKFIDLHEWLDTFYFSLEIIEADSSFNKALQYYRLGDVPKPFNSHLE